MKSPLKLQEKLKSLLKQQRHLYLLVPETPWNDRELHDAAWVVQAYVNSQSDVIETEPLKDWLDEYKFHVADKGG